ncbi:MAG: hypothetical protein K0S61_561 [Anaerocolumna sp.]|nr:hypothetical protein [Anaerocolumna sp.]
MREHQKDDNIYESDELTEQTRNTLHEMMQDLVVSDIENLINKHMDNLLELINRKVEETKNSYQITESNINSRFRIINDVSAACDEIADNVNVLSETINIQHKAIQSNIGETLEQTQTVQQIIKSHISQFSHESQTMKTIIHDLDKNITDMTKAVNVKLDNIQEIIMNTINNHSERSMNSLIEQESRIVKLADQIESLKRHHSVLHHESKDHITQMNSTWKRRSVVGFVIQGGIVLLLLFLIFQNLA